jgi:hypothetical protein
MAEDLIKDVSGRLRVRGTGGDQILRELHSHLQASQYDLELRGSPPEEAARETIRRFGDPAEVAEMLTAVHRSHIPKLRLIGAVTLALAGLSAWFGTLGTFAAPHAAPHSRHHHARIHRGHRHADGARHVKHRRHGA